MDTVVVKIATKAAVTAAFLRFQCNPTLELSDTTVAPLPHKQVVLMVVSYMPNRIRAFDTALRAFCRSIDEQNQQQSKDVIVLYGSYLPNNQYVLALSRVKYILRITDNAALPSNASLQSASPSPNERKVRTKMELSDIPTVIANLEAYLKTSEGSDKLRHEDEVYEDIELVVESADANELLLYMHSQEHHVTMHYVVTVDYSLAIVDIIETCDEDCKACMAEYNERVQLGRGGW